MTNNKEFVYKIIEDLKSQDIETILFGGWAEEINGTIIPREHKDIDFLYLADDFSKVDEFISSNKDITEVNAKHFTHKRAFVFSGILVEFLLVKNEDSKSVTKFWNEFILKWPENPLFVKIDNFMVAKQEVIDFYRGNFDSINEIRKKNI